MKQKQTIKLNEIQLNKLIRESIKSVLKESFDERVYFTGVFGLTSNEVHDVLIKWANSNPAYREAAIDLSDMLMNANPEVKDTTFNVKRGADGNLIYTDYEGNPI